MRGMLLAAGRGVRMEPLSSLIPKPALPVLGQPLLAPSLQTLAAGGCHAIVVNLHHRPEQVVAAVRQVPVRCPVLFSLEPHLLGPAGGLAAARSALAGGPVLVANADCWSQLDLQPLLAAGSPELAVLALLPHPDRRRWGAVEVDQQGRVRRFWSPGEGLDRPGFLFTGFQLLGEHTLPLLPQPPAPMMAFWQPLVSQGRLYAVVVSGAFAEAGDPYAYWQLVMDRLAGATYVHPAARVEPSACLKQTAVSVGAHIQGGARLEGCVVLPGAVVGEGAELCRCIVGRTVAPGERGEDLVLLPHQDRPLPTKN
ncbi:MAG: sugar phosphate nucleotidyltransferase [Thermoanaerobaculum sp.]|nr:sugar phosphate nucleotidyltransferase [Thermoanaerobaculum sp.]MCX7895618.1 sugar phosphate nucleotidyltransferase [Thermoanaerobaculum sp.]MDW7967189.1 sugar phosphate nucleotidyltransferase [Thermoanaerobaculum sp.]